MVSSWFRREITIARQIFFALVAASFNAFSQSTGGEALRFYDSARANQFRDFERTQAFADSAQAALTPEQAKEYTLKIYIARVNACRAFHRPALEKQFIDEFSRFVSRSRELLGDDYERQVQESNIFLGDYYMDTGNYQKALSVLTAAVSELKKMPQTRDICVALYSESMNIASMLAARGEYEAAVNQHLATKVYLHCHEQGLGLELRIDDLLVYRNVAQVLIAKKDFARARRYIDLAEDALNVVIADPGMRRRTGSNGIALMETKASYFREVNKPDSALVALRQASSLLSYAEPFRPRVYKALGDAYAALNQFELAWKHYNDVIALLKRDHNEKDLGFANAWLAMGALSEKERDPKKAMAFYIKAMNSLILKRDSDDETSPPLENVLSKKLLLDALQHQSQLLLSIYNKNRDVNALTRAWNVSKLSVALLDSTMNEVSLQKDKLIMAEQSFSAYENAIRIGYELSSVTNDPNLTDECFSLIDKSKGIILLENLRFVNSFSGLDPKWFEQERLLKSEVSLAEQDLYEEEVQNRNTEKLHTLRASFATKKNEYAALLKRIQQEAPDYYNLRFDHHVITPSVLKKELLNDREALITFFVGDSTLTIMGFTKNKQYFHHEPLPKQLPALVSACRKALFDPEDELLREAFQELADLTIAKCLASFDEPVESLVIVPDGILGYVPFEILPTRDGKTLVDQYNIRYAHSATYLHEQTIKKVRNAERFFGGFVSAGSESLSSEVRRDGKLVYAEEEVTSIATLISQPAIFNPAFKTDFTSNASKYQILHLAMHSVLNDQDPMRSTMVFAIDERDSVKGHELTALELYNLKLEADLAVLSACNTGSGELRRGEGIMSFSRAFAYAGVPSALISLWKVPDKATSKIMLGFYTHLKAGATKAEALRKAKNEFVEAYPAMKHPYYWSGFILAGNDEPIPFPTNNWWWYAMPSLIVVAFGLYYLIVKAKRNLRS